MVAKSARIHSDLGGIRYGFLRRVRHSRVASGGRLVDKVDLRWIVSAGLGIFAITSLLGAFNNTEVNFDLMFLESLPWGVGTACFFIPLVTLAMSGVSPEKLARRFRYFSISYDKSR
jgi:MFS family permease